MSILFEIIHAICMYLATGLTIILVDIPVKIIGFIAFLIFMIVGCIFYPIAKNIEGRDWITNFYGYVTTNQWIAIKVYNAYKY